MFRTIKPIATRVYVFVNAAVALLVLLAVFTAVNWGRMPGGLREFLAICIDYLRRLPKNEIACCEASFIRVGQRVRVRGGCLHGIEGNFVQCNQDRSLVSSIAALQRS